MATSLDTDPRIARSVGDGVLAVYADIVCPWATVVLDRLRRVEHELVLDVVVDIRPFPLELVNEDPAPFDVHVAGVEAAASVAPDYGFAAWDSPEGFPVTTLPALEAVRSAYQQSADAAVQLDAALRRAFFVEHRCISLHPVVVEVAEECDDVDAAEIESHLRAGRYRCDVFDHLDTARELDIEGSPHVLLADGTSEFLPSLEVDADDDGVEVTEDDPARIEDLLRHAAQTRHHD